MNTPITNRVQNRRAGAIKLTAAELAKKKKKLGETATTGGSTGGSTSSKIVEGKKKKGKIIKASTDRCGTQAEKDAGKVKQTCKESGFSDLSSEEVAASEEKQGLRSKSTVDCLEGSTKDADGNCVETTKKDGVNYETNLQQSNFGTSLTYEETREKKLNNTATNGYLRKSKIREAKYKGKVNKATSKYDLPDKDGKKDGVLSDEEISKMPTGFLGFGNKQKSYIKNRAKAEENELERKNFESLSANAQLDSASGVKQGGTYQKADTDVTKGQRGPEQQAAEAKRLAEKAARDKEKAAKEKAAIDAAKKTAQEETEQQTAEVENVTTGQSGRAIGTNEAAAIEPGAGPGGMFDVGEYAKTDYSKILQGNSAFAKKGYKQKAKSVATKKLQGAQGKLPSHLQAAIKAAPGKRSVLKKSYFKNK